MRRFKLYRSKDITGVSGTGTIAEGVQFSNGTVVFMWLSDKASLTIFPREEGGIDGVLEKHGHHGDTVVMWMD